ncbi:MAG: CHAT domain-containing protein, partial [Sciscionella sp.]
CAALMRRGDALRSVGRHRTALADLDQAILDCDRHADGHWRANAHNARALIHLERGDFAEAQADYRLAARMYTELGLHERSACVEHNIGYVKACRGDPSGALACFEAAARGGLALWRHPELLVDEAEALLRAGAVAAARDAIVRAAEALLAVGRQPAYAESLLRLAQCALAAGDNRAAAQLARRCVGLFFAQRRRNWLCAALALHSLAELRCTPEQRSRAGEPDAVLVLRRARAAARSGWPELASDLAKEITEHRDPLQLHDLAAVAHHPNPAVAAHGWLVVGRGAARLGDRGGAARAARAGLRLIDDLGDRFDGIGLRLAELGLAAALGGRAPRRVLRWLELMARLRVHDRARVQWCFADCAAALGSRALLVFGELDGELLSVSVRNGRARLHRHGPCDEAAALAAKLRFAMDCGRETAVLASAVQRVVLPPAWRREGLGNPIVVPAPSLRDLPFAELPALRGTGLCLVPSVAQWLHARRRTSGDPHRAPVWVAGPGLRHSVPEVRELARRHGGAVLSGTVAARASVLACLAGASTVHIAAHGQCEPVAPLLGGLRLADGELCGYHLDECSGMPELVVFASCAAGRSAVALHGLCLGLLARGARAVIASVLDVSDAGTVPLMTALHEGLAEGLSPAQALAAAQCAHGGHGFHCYGDG